MRCLVGLALCGMTACTGASSSEIRVVRSSERLQLTVMRVDVGEMVGISGADTDEQGRLWVVSERQAQLRPLRRQGDALVAAGLPVAVAGLEAGLELESLARLPDRGWVVGTEAGQATPWAQALVVDEAAGGLRVQRRVTAKLTSLGLTAEDNHGIEGVCVADSWMVLLFESRRADDTAVLMLQSIDGERRVTHRVKLTTATGKLAGADCRMRADGRIEVLAIERHYGVARVLEVLLDPSASSRAWEAVVLVDLAPLVEPLPNFESIVRVDDELILITDNHHGRVTGPTQALAIDGLRLDGAQNR